MRTTAILHDIGHLPYATDIRYANPKRHNLPKPPQGGLPETGYRH